MKHTPNNGEPLPSTLPSEGGQSRGNLPSQADIGWLAGILDGEGHIGLRMNIPREKNHTRFDVTVSIGNTSLPLIEKARDIIFALTNTKPKIGLAPLGTKTAPTILRKQDYYQIQVTRQVVVRKVLEAVLPHLTEKARRAELVIWFCQLRKESRHTGYNKPWGPEEARIVLEFEQFRRTPYNEITRKALLEKVCAEGLVETEWCAPGEANATLG